MIYLTPITFNGKQPNTPRVVVANRDDNNSQALPIRLPVLDASQTVTLHWVDSDANGQEIPLEARSVPGEYLWVVSETDTRKKADLSVWLEITVGDDTLWVSDTFIASVGQRLSHNNIIAQRYPDKLQELIDDVRELQENDSSGTVTSVNGVPPDENGNVEIETVSQEEIGEAVEEYLTENPVEVTETDPTVPEWAKNANMPVATAESVGGVKVGDNLEVDDDGTLSAKVDFIPINYMQDLPEYIQYYKLILISTSAVYNPTEVAWSGALLVMRGDMAYGVYDFSAFDGAGAFYQGSVNLRNMSVSMQRSTANVVNITENEDGTYSADQLFYGIVATIENGVTPVACFYGGYYPLVYFVGQQEPIRFHGSYNSVLGDGFSVEHEFASIIINPDNSVEVNIESAETPTMRSFEAFALEAINAFIPKPDMSSTPDQLLAVNEVDEDGKPTSWKTVDAPGGGGGIEVTGATVGQTVKIAAVDSSGVPTAWEPVDFPKGEEWKTITYDFSSESVSSVTFELPSKKIKRGKLSITAMQTGETTGGKSGWRIYADVVAVSGYADKLYTSGGGGIYTNQRTATFVWEALTDGFVKVNTIDFAGSTVFEKRYVNHAAQDYLYFVLTTTGAAMTGTATLIYSE